MVIVILMILLPISKNIPVRNRADEAPGFLPVQVFLDLAEEKAGLCR